MEIEKKFDDGKVIYHIIGRIDTQTAPDLQAALDQGLEEGENKNQNRRSDSHRNNQGPRRSKRHEDREKNSNN